MKIKLKRNGPIQEYNKNFRRGGTAVRAQGLLNPQKTRVRIWNVRAGRLLLFWAMKGLERASCPLLGVKLLTYI